MKHVQSFDSFLNESLLNEAFNSKTSKQSDEIKAAVEQTSKDSVYTFHTDRNSAYKKICGPLRMSEYSSGNYGLSAHGYSFFDSYSKKTVYEIAAKEGVLLLNSSESKKIDEMINYLENAFYKNIPLTAYSGPSPSPYGAFGMPKPKYAFDGITLHISLDIPRAVRHPNEYKHYHENEKYKDTFKRIQEIENAIDDISSYVQKKGYKVEISAW